MLIIRAFMAWELNGDTRDVHILHPSASRAEHTPGLHGTFLLSPFPLIAPGGDFSRERQSQYIRIPSPDRDPRSYFIPAVFFLPRCYMDDDCFFFHS
ncbi:hypothetical protein K439DRAFT_368112 [Ramaria rubella]|nr:hypothetical protein K439DRAFT_368112 [Ramaria rubella]